MRRISVFALLLVLLPTLNACRTCLEPVPADPMSWVALAPDGTWIEDYPQYREDKSVGMFYFLWLGCHGYDSPANYNEVHYPAAADTLSPFNNEEIYKLDPAHPKDLPFGGFSVFHHWGEPYLGYYLSDDGWVFRKHAQMLSDAGVDAVFFDATNGYHYSENAKILADEWTALRQKGCNTPQLGFLLNCDTDRVFDAIYSNFYGPGLYKDLWFHWEDKPLVLALQDNVKSRPTSDFSFRMSWFTFNIAGADDWYDGVGGEGLLPWGGWYPQKPGYHNGKLESVPVMAATHPNSNIGRSFDPIAWEQPAVPQSEKGTHFKAQMERALALDPEFIFFTGWNEWVAQRQVPDPNVPMMGIPSTEFGGYFVDHFNHEFSRDLEPVRGGFGDAYYYYLVDAVRRFKGAKPAAQYSEYAKIRLDGYAGDWEGVQAAFGDDCGDATQHEHTGWGRVGTLRNHARNDIVLCKVATDGENVYFYAQCAKKLSDCRGDEWMKLFIGVNPKENPNWEGFDYAVQRLSSKGGKVALEKSEGGYNWTKTAEVRRAVGKRAIEICIPLAELGITDAKNFTVDFKWIDDTAADGDIQSCLSDGDSAPNGRFRYRYIHIQH